jgi:hypothetical protein
MQLYIENDRCYADGRAVSWPLYMKLVALEDGILFDFVLERDTHWQVDGEIVPASIYRAVKARLNDRRLIQMTIPRCQAMGCSNLLPAGRRKYCSDQCATRQRVQDHRDAKKLERVQEGRKIIRERKGV